MYGDHRSIQPIVGPTGDISRRVIRRSVGYFLALAQNIREAVGGDMIQGLIFLAIIQANLQPILEDETLDALYGGLDDIPPDAHRVPVSAYAVARDLGVPYETVRRNAKLLIAGGLVERAASNGLVVPSRVFERPEIRRAALRIGNETKALLGALAEVGLRR